ncbi:hypothetical protein ABZ896_37790 [Streptomyces sp. NPDC047072]|uniref:hypothetical protein n=1 Tax=Streptomyces sp. NPDC047072 TaxID=3154809 RepID=UPI0034030803
MPMSGEYIPARELAWNDVQAELKSKSQARFTFATAILHFHELDGSITTYQMPVSRSGRDENAAAFYATDERVTSHPEFEQAGIDAEIKTMSDARLSWEARKASGVPDPWKISLDSLSSKPTCNSCESLLMIVATDLQAAFPEASVALKEMFSRNQLNANNENHSMIPGRPVRGTNPRVYQSAYGNPDAIPEHIRRTQPFPAVPGSYSMSAAAGYNAERIRFYKRTILPLAPNDYRGPIQNPVRGFASVSSFSDQSPYYYSGSSNRASGSSGGSDSEGHHSARSGGSGGSKRSKGSNQSGESYLSEWSNPAENPGNYLPGANHANTQVEPTYDQTNGLYVTPGSRRISVPIDMGYGGHRYANYDYVKDVRMGEGAPVEHAYRNVNDGTLALYVPNQSFTVRTDLFVRRNKEIVPYDHSKVAGSHAESSQSNRRRRRG